MHWKYCGHHSFCDFCKTHWFFCKLTVSSLLVLSVQCESNLDTGSTEMRNQTDEIIALLWNLAVLSIFFNASSVTSYFKIIILFKNMEHFKLCISVIWCWEMVPRKRGPLIWWWNLWILCVKSWNCIKISVLDFLIRGLASLEIVCHHY